MQFPDVATEEKGRHVKSHNAKLGFGDIDLTESQGT
jgi:hypothetical protein